MSLDVSLILHGEKVQHAGTGIYVREHGRIRQISRAEWDEKFPGREPIAMPVENENIIVYEANITHNLCQMAGEAGLYEYLWRPEEVEVKYALHLVSPLEKGLSVLKDNPGRFKKFNPPNGWGSYDALVNFVEKYLDACRRYPDAEIDVSR